MFKTSKLKSHGFWVKVSLGSNWNFAQPLNSSPSGSLSVNVSNSIAFCICRHLDLFAAFYIILVRPQIHSHSGLQKSTFSIQNGLGNFCPLLWFITYYFLNSFKSSYDFAHYSRWIPFLLQTNTKTMMKWAIRIFWIFRVSFHCMSRNTRIIELRTNKILKISDQFPWFSSDIALLENYLSNKPKSVSSDSTWRAGNS